MMHDACENNSRVSTTDTISIDAVSDDRNTMNLSNNNNSTAEAGTDSNIFKGASKSNDDVCDVNDILNNITVDNKDNNLSICSSIIKADNCANCGKEGSSDNMNTCNKCKVTKYCNAACKKKHRSKHKKECEELQRLAAQEDLTDQSQDVECSILVCANCGKGDDADLKKFCGCNLVKYCSVSCQIAHHPQHKKQCRKRIMEVFESSIINKDDEISDKILFQQPPPDEDCPICFITLPSFESGSTFHPCCGKVICSGCIHVLSKIDKDEKCPFCRTPAPDSHEAVELERRLVEKDNAEAIYNLGVCYRDGIDSEGRNGNPQDYVKAFGLFARACKLGYASAYTNIGNAYDYGEGVEVDEKKATHYYELAAIKGDSDARYNLGMMEEEAGNMGRALKHHIIAVRSGHTDSLKEIQDMYSNGFATKEDYTKALRARQAYLGEIKSRQRDEAAAFDNEDYRYY